MERLDGLLHWEFPLPEGCNCRTIVMRETDGLDEEEAAIFSDAHGGSLAKHLIRLSIVAVDGNRVQQPFTSLDKWTSKTRSLVMAAYEKLNDLPDKEVAVFLGASRPVTAALAPIPQEAEEEEAPETTEPSTND
jgi:hypothetical protein